MYTQWKYLFTTIEFFDKKSKKYFITLGKYTGAYVITETKRTVLYT